VKLKQRQEERALEKRAIMEARQQPPSRGLDTEASFHLKEDEVCEEERKETSRKKEQEGTRRNKKERIRRISKKGARRNE
jgi:hypothetical protein